jgi:hypothetical protein
MLLRFGTRTFIKSLLIAAGLPAMLAAQSPYTLPSYPQNPAGAPAGYSVPTGYGVPAGYVSQPQATANAPASIPVSGGAAVPGYSAVGYNNGLMPSSVAPNISGPSAGIPNVSASSGTVASQYPASSMPNSVQVPGFGMPGAAIQRPSMPTRLVSNSTFTDEPTMSTSDAFNASNTQLASCQTCGPTGYSGGTGYSGPTVGSDVDYSCNGMPWCDGPSNSGFFVSLEALVFFMNKPQVATFGDDASERNVTVNGVTYRIENSLDSSWLSNSGGWGQRLELGNVNQDCGWFVSLWNVKQAQTYSTSGVSFVPADPNGLMRGFVDGNADSIDDDLNGNNIYGRNGQDLGTFDAGPPPGFIPPFDGTPDVGAPVDVNDMVSWLQTYSNVTSSNKLTLINAELNRLYRVPGHSWSHEVDYYYGIRYLQVKDIYNITANGGFLDQSVWNTESDNNLIGPQIGMRWSRRTKAVGFSVDGRFFAAYNRQDNDLRGYTASNFAANGAANNPAALTSESFVDGFGNDAFSPTGELRADMILKMSRSWAFKVGYTGLVVGDVSRASPKVVYALPRSSLRDVESDTTLISHGVNFGLEYNR